jgi:hypothetical protein
MNAMNEGKRLHRLGFTNKICVAVIIEDFLVTACCLYFCYLAIRADFSGSLPYLSALIGLEQAKTGVILPFVVNKNKVENTKNGIVFERAMAEINSKIDA